MQMWLVSAGETRHRTHHAAFLTIREIVNRCMTDMSSSQACSMSTVQSGEQQASPSAKRLESGRVEKMKWVSGTRFPCLSTIAEPLRPSSALSKPGSAPIALELKTSPHQHQPTQPCTSQESSLPEHFLLR